MNNNAEDGGAFWVKLATLGVVIFIKTIPKGAKNAIERIVEDASGQKYLKIRVTTVPENGKANKAVIKLLSKVWRLPVSSFSIVSGVTDRTKRIAITGDAEVLMERIIDWEKRRDSML